VFIEYLVIGGGIYGTGTAWELATQDKDVVLLEADEIAGGASGGLGKRGVRANGRDPRELPLISIAYDLWPALSEEIGYDTGYKRTGHLLVYEKKTGGIHGGFESADARRQVQSEFGVPTELLSAESVRGMEPHASDDVVGALYCPDDGVVDHTSATLGLARAARDHGATIHENSPVTGFERAGDQVTSVVTTNDTFEVEEAVLLLSNTHVPELLESELGIRLPVWTMFPQVIATEPMAEVPVNHLIGHDHRRLALKEIPDDRVMISGGWRGELDETTGEGVTVPERVRGNVDDAQSLYPALKDVAVERADASRRESVTVDRVPIIDTFSTATNVIAATGWSGHGFAISLAINQLVAQWAMENTRPDLLAPFSADRFAANGILQSSSYVS